MMGSQGGGGTMSSSSSEKAREAVSGYRSASSEEVKQEKVESLAKVLMRNVFKKKEPTE
jgi:hypothetical protein